MCQALIRRVKHKKIEIIEPKRVIELFVSDSGVRGVAAMDAGTAKVSRLCGEQCHFRFGRTCRNLCVKRVSEKSDRRNRRTS